MTSAYQHIYVVNRMTSLAANLLIALLGWLFGLALYHSRSANWRRLLMDVWMVVQ